MIATKKNDGHDVPETPLALENAIGEVRITAAKRSAMPPQSRNGKNRLQFVELAFNGLLS